MVVMRGFPFPIEKVTVVTDAGDPVVVVSKPESMTGLWTYPRTQLRPIAVP